MFRLIRAFVLLALSALILLLMSLVAFWQHLEDFAQTGLSIPRVVEITIEKGTSPAQIAAKLEQKGVINSARDFYWYLRYVARKAETLRAGDYTFLGEMNPKEVIALLQKGLKREIRFTVPEGASKTDIARIIETSGLVKKEDVFESMNAFELIKSFGVPVVGAGGQQEGVSGGVEGYLFPDTYQFPQGTKAVSVLLKMRQRLEDVFDPAMRQRMQELGLNLHQVLTLASIVEKETGKPEERPQVASVFYNRLRKHMKLQTDPTVIYAMIGYNGNITKKDLSLQHAYNTYVNEGLPPGPIASPGLQSIKAVLWPASTKYFYFVSKNDGSHLFCETYACHVKAVNQWQLRRKI